MTHDLWLAPWGSLMYFVGRSIETTQRQPNYFGKTRLKQIIDTRIRKKSHCAITISTTRSYVIKITEKCFNMYHYFANSIFFSCIYCMCSSKYLGFLQFFILNIHSDNIRGTKCSCYLQTAVASDIIVTCL